MTDPELAGVVVLGVHRSGTSAITGLFARAGFHVGDPEDEIPPDPTNPAGYGELRETVSLNDGILERLGGNWFHPPDPALVETNGARFVGSVRDRLDRLLDAAGERPLVVKDPRIALMLPIWVPAIGGRLHPVLAVRHPLEVAESLARRNAMPVRVALAAWELATARLLDGLAGVPVSVAPYARLLTEPRSATALVQEVVGALAPGRAARVSLAATAAGLRPELRHERVDGDSDATEERLTGHQRRLWEWLAALAPGRRRLEPPAALRAASSDAAALTGLLTRRLRLEAAISGVRDALPAP